jgi:hypothetical protein
VIIDIGKWLFEWEGDARKMTADMGEAWGRMMNCGREQKSLMTRK